jgi:hypothetical protein
MLNSDWLLIEKLLADQISAGFFFTIAKMKYTVAQINQGLVEVLF